MVAMVDETVNKRVPKKEKKIGHAEDRTPCLSHAKRALYHLSYITFLLNLGLIYITKRGTRAAQTETKFRYLE